MNAPNSPAQARAWRRRTAAVFAAVGALIFSSGLVMITAPAANAASVGICHATGSDSHPYNFIGVDTSSTEYRGHLEHALHPDFAWKNGTWWNGTWNPAGSAKPDLVSGVTFDGPVTSALCNLLGTGAIDVRPSVNFFDPACGNNNTASWQGTDLDKVTYTLTSGTVAASQSVVVGATPKPGYVVPNNAATSFSWSYGAAADCRSTVGADAPSVAQPACTGPGTSSDLVVTLATTPAGVSYAYDESTGVVTATVTDAGKKFAATLGADWVRVSDTVATFQVTRVPAGACLVTVSASAPSATDPSCELPGHLVLPSSAGDGYSWTGETTDAPGDHVVTAVADAGHQLTGQTEWTVHVAAAGEGLTTCGSTATEVTPLEPMWVEATCTTGASVTYQAVEGVQYATTGDVAPEGTATVTASPVGNHVLAAGADDSWTHTFDAEPTDCDGPIDPADEVVTPSYPSAQAATCSRDGVLNVPDQPEGVLMTQTGSVPGDVTFTFAPESGFVFATGTDTEVTVSVGAKLTGEDCILGEESTRPKPKPTPTPKTRDRAPIVLGSQAAVPTAVAAGLSGLPTTSVSSSSSPRLAQALVAGGLLMLVAGASMGLGRRPRGVHES